MINKNFIIFIATYIGLRLFSFYLPPGNIINDLLAVIIIGITTFYLLKKNYLAWIIIASELLLGGSGSYIKFYSLSVRSWLLGISTAIFFFQNIKTITKILLNNYYIILLVGIGLFGALIGFKSGNLSARIISDFVPYLFILYYFPLQNLIKNSKFVEVLKSIVLAAIFGQLVFILFTFFGFNFNFFVLQDIYYHWYRDIAGGKITYFDQGFYRLILNEQLLLIPAAIWVFSKSIYNLNKYIFLLIPIIILLSINFTRIYFLGFIGGILLIMNRENWRRWIKTTVIAAILTVFTFSTLFFVASRGKSFGFEIFSSRAQSIIKPDTENSSLSRLLLLPKIIEIIQKNTIFGSGLGSTVTVYSPVLKTNINTPHFDWGYLEIFAELGIIGVIIWIVFIAKLIVLIKKQPVLKAILTSLLLINLTSPAIFHVFGLILITFLIAYSSDASQELSALHPRTSSPSST